MGKGEASLSYTVKNNRLSFFQLHSSMSYNNRFIYEVGNPLLTPATYHNLQLSTLYRWLQFSISYQYPFMLFAPPN
ncbi:MULTISPECIES: outer membrane beta-barrel protein [Bacteroides]|uniref:outer membrane beta-barrel protein n=1 Tax=Bacteroides TaxID=816 RepID=UPI001F29B267|nr:MULTISPECIES: outer membrane beta-barrel protein [Bacteroides]